MVVPKWGGSLAIFMYYWKNSGNIHVLLVTSGQHSCPRVNKYSCLIGTFSKQNIYCGKSGRWYIGYGRGGWKLVISDGRGIAT